MPENFYTYVLKTMTKNERTIFYQFTYENNTYTRDIAGIIVQKGRKAERGKSRT